MIAVSVSEVSFSYPEKPTKIIILTLFDTESYSQTLMDSYHILPSLWFATQNTFIFFQHS